MFLYGSVGDRTLLWCLLLWATKALASSRMPSSGHSLLPWFKWYLSWAGAESKFSLTPRRIPVERKTPAAKREGDQDMVAKEESVSDAESGWSGVSDNSSTDSECTDVEASSLASDQDRFDTAYDAFRDLANDLYDIDLRRYPRGVTSEDAAGVPLIDGQEKPQELVHLPRTWPLARLTIPLEGLSKQIDRLLEGYCFQILATNRNPEAHNGRVLQTATHLTWILAEYLADTIAWLMRSILGHATKILFDKDTQLLLTPKFWIFAVSGIPQQCTAHPTEPLFRKSSWLHGVGQDHM